MGKFVIGNLPVWIAVIAAIASFLTAIISAIFTWRQAHSVESLRIQGNTILEDLKSRFDFSTEQLKIQSGASLEHFRHQANLNITAISAGNQRLQLMENALARIIHERRSR